LGSPGSSGCNVFAISACPSVIERNELVVAQCAMAGGRFSSDLAIYLNQRRNGRVMVSILEPSECFLEKCLEFGIGMSGCADHQHERGQSEDAGGHRPDLRHQCHI